MGVAATLPELSEWTLLAAGMNRLGLNLENLVNYLYPCPDTRHFMVVTRRTLGFRHRN